MLVEGRQTLCCMACRLLRAACQISRRNRRWPALPPRARDLGLYALSHAYFPSDPASADTGEALNDAEVMELASRLLNTRSEAERDHLLGATLTLAAERTGGALPAPVGRALGGLLKSVAAQALVGPQPGRALGLELGGLTVMSESSKRCCASSALRAKRRATRRRKD